jgi:hypothetical protein
MILHWVTPWVISLFFRPESSIFSLLLYISICHRRWESAADMRISTFFQCAGSGFVKKEKFFFLINRPSWVVLAASALKIHLKSVLFHKCCHVLSRCVRLPDNGYLLTDLYRHVTYYPMVCGDLWWSHILCLLNDALSLSMRDGTSLLSFVYFLTLLLLLVVLKLSLLRWLLHPQIRESNLLVHLMEQSTTGNGGGKDKGELWPAAIGLQGVQKKCPCKVPGDQEP